MFHIFKEKMRELTLIQREVGFLFKNFRNQLSQASEYLAAFFQTIYPEKVSICNNIEGLLGIILGIFRR